MPHPDREPGQNLWLSERTPRWQAIAENLSALQDSKPTQVETLREALRDYAEIARDLAIARSVNAQGRVTAHLEYLYAGLHRALF